MLKCELCGSALIKVDDNVFACEGCGCKYSKEQALKLLGINSEASTPASANNDFVIVAGVLKEYTGSAVDVEVPEGVLEIGGNVFEGMTSLRSVKLPNSLKRIQSCAFYGCTSLREVLFSHGLEMIGNSAFMNCTSLKVIKLPDTLILLCSGCFAGCISLEDITLPQQLKEIQQNAFSGCESLVRLIIPDSVEKIGNISTYSGVPVYSSICKNYFYGAAGNGCNNLTVRMPSRFDCRLVAGCKYLYDLSGKRMETAEKFYENERERNYRRNNHLCLSCGGEIGIFSNKCKRCGKPFGEV